MLNEVRVVTVDLLEAMREQLREEVKAEVLESLRNDPVMLRKLLARTFCKHPITIMHQTKQYRYCAICGEHS